MPKIIIASGPVIIKDDKVLLCQHGNATFWKFCGGQVEDYDQNLENNARREVREEMGIDIEILNPVPFITYTKKEQLEGNCDVILVHFLAKRIGEIKPGEDIREWNWFPLDNLPTNLGPNILPALKHFGFIK